VHEPATNLYLLLLLPEYVDSDLRSSSPVRAAFKWHQEHIFGKGVEQVFPGASTVFLSSAASRRRREEDGSESDGTAAEDEVRSADGAGRCAVDKSEDGETPNVSGKPTMQGKPLAKGLSLRERLEFFQARRGFVLGSDMT